MLKLSFHAPRPAEPRTDSRAASDSPEARPRPALLATRRLLPVEADAGMVMHAQVFLATHPVPERTDRPAQQRWLQGLYRLMASAAPLSSLSEEDMAHALAFHCGCTPEQIRGSLNLTHLREACESALSGLRVGERMV